MNRVRLQIKSLENVIHIVQKKKHCVQLQVNAGFTANNH